MTISSYRLEAELCQYTPLLHFQGGEEGACLRASEVKPKLDRFLLTCLERSGIREADIPESWKLSIPVDEAGTLHTTAFRYKMRFEGIGRSEETEVHPLYFADNMTGSSKSIVHNDGVKLTIVALEQQRLLRSVRLFQDRDLNNPTLLELIQEIVPAFFSLYCFGTRSNKGFGSFSIKGASVSAANLRHCMPRRCLAIFDLESETSKSDPDKYGMFERLDDVYVLSAMMKGGVNLSFSRSPAYYKGDIHMLLPANCIGSEKAYLKQQVFTASEKEWYRSRCNHQHQEPEEYQQYRFIRAMLGLTDTYTFGVGKSAKRFSVRDANEDIERFANPITFKPYENGLLVLVHQIPQRMLGAKFQFRDSEHVISTPEQFDIVKFTSDFLRQLNGDIKNPFWYDFRDANPRIRINGRTIVFENTLSDLRLVEEGGN